MRQVLVVLKDMRDERKNDITMKNYLYRYKLPFYILLLDLGWFLINEIMLSMSQTVFNLANPIAREIRSLFIDGWYLIHFPVWNILEGVFLSTNNMHSYSPSSFTYYIVSFVCIIYLTFLSFLFGILLEYLGVRVKAR